MLSFHSLRNQGFMLPCPATYIQVAWRHGWGLGRCQELILSRRQVGPRMTGGDVWLGNLLSLEHDKKTSLGGFLNTCHVGPVGVWNPPRKAEAAQSKTWCPNATGIFVCPLCVALQMEDTSSKLLVCLLTHSFFHLFIHSINIEWFITITVTMITRNINVIYLESSIFQALLFNSIRNLQGNDRYSISLVRKPRASQVMWYAKVTYLWSDRAGVCN